MEVEPTRHGGMTRIDVYGLRAHGSWLLRVVVVLEGTTLDGDHARRARPRDRDRNARPDVAGERAMELGGVHRAYGLPFDRDDFVARIDSRTRRPHVERSIADEDSTIAVVFGE